MKKNNGRLYIIETLEMMKKNISESIELTETLVSIFCHNDYDSIVLVVSGSSYNAAICAKMFMETNLRSSIKILTQLHFLYYWEIAETDIKSVNI